MSRKKPPASQPSSILWSLSGQFSILDPLLCFRFAVGHCTKKDYEAFDFAAVVTIVVAVIITVTVTVTVTITITITITIIIISSLFVHFIWLALNHRGKA